MKVEHGFTGHVFEWLVLTLCAIYRLFVVQKLWLWFLTPVVGLAPPTIVVMCGLNMLVRLFLTHESFVSRWSRFVEQSHPDHPWTRTWILVAAHVVMVTGAWIVGGVLA